MDDDICHSKDIRGPKVLEGIFLGEPGMSRDIVEYAFQVMHYEPNHIMIFIEV